ncbi:MlaD family protein [uncultured Williamsia sp.]|uniref:MlaD family protein n=1 Tax=uncultured Williamsia sp. TaxID=259311 RepID=UPI00260B460D|nr:MlaD family protein [uncultured Williamsia sp.]
MTGAILDPSGRGASARVLLLSGVGLLAVVALAVAGLISLSEGTLRSDVPVRAMMTNLGDGLPAKADVKYQGVLVGSVSGVTSGPRGGTDVVDIDLDPTYARSVPATVTARIVPSNVFGVPSVELVDNGPARPLFSGAEIVQDTSESTIRLQSALDRINQIVSAVGRGSGDDAVGVLSVLSEATADRGAEIDQAGSQLRQIVATMNGIVSDRSGPSTVESVTTALREVNASVPDGLDALNSAIGPMLTLARQRAGLESLLGTGTSTLGRVDIGLGRNLEKILATTSKAGPVVSALGDGAAKFPQIAASVDYLSRQFLSVWDPVRQMFTAKAIVQFTPNRQYTRAECPRYGDLAGKSCSTAPVTAPPQTAASPIDPRAFQIPDGLGTPDIGSTGSAQEQALIGQILGVPPNAASTLLFGQIARGTTVDAVPLPGEKAP